MESGQKGLSLRGAFGHSVGTAIGVLVIDPSLNKTTAGHIQWVAPMLMDIATVVAESSSLDLHITIFVTCLCDPDAVPPIPNCDVTLESERPSVRQLINDLIAPPVDDAADQLRWVGLGGGLGICASGPRGLTREVSNVVAKLSLSTSVDEIGGIALHTETFVL